jgi:hypothetical protein
MTPDLAPNEKILWQGRPNAAPHITANHILRLLRGLIMLGLFLYIIARLNMGLSQYFDIQVIVFALFFLAVPLDILKSAYIRKISTYALTSHRAIIQMNIPFTGKRTQFYPILPTTAFETLKRKALTSLLFATPKRPFWDLRGQPAKVGFERITDGDHVFALITQIQRGDA